MGFLEPGPNNVFFRSEGAQRPSAGVHQLGSGVPSWHGSLIAPHSFLLVVSHISPARRKSHDNTNHPPNKDKSIGFLWSVSLIGNGSPTRAFELSPRARRDRASRLLQRAAVRFVCAKRGPCAHVVRDILRHFESCGCLVPCRFAM